MKALLLACLASCYIPDGAEIRYDRCDSTWYRMTYCETYYEWVPGWWTVHGEFVDGFYRLRPGYRETIRDHRVWIEHGHRGHR